MSVIGSAKFKMAGDWGDRHGVHTLPLTVQQNLDFFAKCFSSISTWFEKDCVIEKYIFKPPFMIQRKRKKSKRGSSSSETEEVMAASASNGGDSMYNELLFVYTCGS